MRSFICIFDSKQEIEKKVVDDATRGERLELQGIINCENSGNILTISGANVPLGKSRPGCGVLEEREEVQRRTHAARQGASYNPH